jgi:hypothetical protein
MSESESSNTGFAAALELWQENQLRILVLISLATQCFLFVFAPLRQHRIPGPLRLSIWLAYLGSDAVAIYALATLFNSHRCDTGTGTGTARAGVELLWAPIMLVHLGGQDSIPAYNIEDNELWRRHVVTAVSQVILVNLSSTHSPAVMHIWSAIMARGLTLTTGRRCYLCLRQVVAKIHGGDCCPSSG